MDVLSSRVLLRPSDPERSRRFYRDVLGLESTFESEFWTTFATGACVLALHGGGKGGEGARIVFDVADVEAARAEMEAKGATFLGPTEGRGGSAWAYIRAPDGHVYELTSRPPDGPSEPGAGER